MAGLRAAPAIVHLVAFIIFLVVGALGAFWARAVQSYELDCYSEISPLPLTAMLREYVESDRYLRQVRVTGVVCLITAGVFLCALLGREI